MVVSGNNRLQNTVSRLGTLLEMTLSYVASRFRCIPIVCMAVVAFACSSARHQEPIPSTDGHRTIAEGYSLIYGITSQQKDLKKLLLIKTESDPVDKVISELADYAGELSAQLEDMAKRYPALTVETQFLPDVEVRARESIASETTKVLLASKGKSFERQLLMKQLTALEEERHISKVMVELETADERRTFWKRTEQRFAELYAKVEHLLEQDYFCGRPTHSPLPVTAVVRPAQNAQALNHGERLSGA